MAKVTLTKANADEIFIGKGQDLALSASLGRFGAPMSPKILAVLGAPAVADADLLIKAATGTEIPDAAETVTYLASATDASPHDGVAPVVTIYPAGSGTPVSAWDVRDGATYGRALSYNATSAGTTVAGTVTVTGYDYLMRPLTETATLAATATSVTAAGKKAICYVASVAITAAAAMTGTTVNVGTGSALGLPYKLAKIGHMTNASLGGAQERVGTAAASGVCGVVAAVTSTASATTGDTRGTVTFNGTLNGTAEAIIEMYIADRNTGPGLVGVTQA